MAFILDAGLVQMLHGQGGHHAFRDYIFWEYMVGDEESFLFTEESCKGYQARFQESDESFLTSSKTSHYFTPREERWAGDPKIAVAQFGNIITRWCYPARDFFIEVVEMMADLFDIAFKIANRVKSLGQNPFKGSSWDIDGGGPFQMWVKLFKSVEKYYLQTDEPYDNKTPWRHGGDFRKWWNYMKADLSKGALCGG